MITVDLPAAIAGAYAFGFVSGGFLVAVLIAAITTWRRRPA